MKIRHSIQLTKWYLVYGLMLAASVLLPAPAMADSQMRFHGTLIAGSCTADATSVEFGEVLLDTIPAAKPGALAGGSVRTSGSPVANFTVTLNCTGNVNEIKYKWSGTTTTFNNQLLTTDVTGLGIELGKGDTASIIPPDTWQSLDPKARSIKMLAILLRNPSATFAGGEFNATATLAIQVP